MNDYNDPIGYWATVLSLLVAAVVISLLIYCEILQ